MRDRRRRTAWVVVALTAAGMIGAALAQDEPPKAEAKKPAAAKKKAGLRARGGAPPKAVRREDQPPAEPPKWPYYNKFALVTADDRRSVAAYYPSKAIANAPVVLMVHDRGAGRSCRDFQEPIEELEGRGLAEHLQEQEYAVLVINLRGHGPGERRRQPDAKEWRAMVGDLQAAYLFLVDRHNRRELNLAKLAVVAVGDGGNLAAAWAAAPAGVGGAVSGEGRVSDLAAVVLASPVEDADGLELLPALASLAARVPILVVAGRRDAALAEKVEPILELHRDSKVESHESPLGGHKLLNLFPGVAPAVVQYLDDQVKVKVPEWEPRYLWSPAVHTPFEPISSTEPLKPDAEAAEVKKDNP